MVIEPSTYRPIYDYCLHVEHTRLAQAYQAVAIIFKSVRQVVPATHLVTDGFIWTKPRKSCTADKLKETIESIKFSDLHRLEDYVREQLEQPEPKQKRLKTADLFPMTALTSDRPVFRVTTPTAGQHLRGVHSIEKVVRACKAPTLDPFIEVENPVDAVLQGKSLLIHGLAGTGKSHLIRETLIPALEAKNKRVVVIAKTHNAAMVSGGDTADHFAWKHIREGSFGADVLWIDEISMLDVALLQELCHLSFRQPPVQFILSGDFNQYDPFFNCFAGEPVRESFEHSQLLRDLSGGNVLRMTACRRSDAQLFDFYSKLVEGAELHGRLGESLQLARSLFRPELATGFLSGTIAPTNLVISHRKRVELNRLCNRADAASRDNCVSFEVKAEISGPNKNQDAKFWPGMVVVACSSGRKVRNGNAYEILEIDENEVHLKRRGTDCEIVLSGTEFFKSMRLAYAVTYASAQGLTLEGLVELHDTDHVHFTQKNSIRRLFESACVQSVDRSLNFHKTCMI